MADENHVREDLLDLMLQKVEDDQYPSSTMLDIVERLLTPDDLERYADVLLGKISNETYPSMSLVRRILAFT